MNHEQILREKSEALAKAHEERDQAIAAAARDGLGATAISRATGVSRAHVYRIIESKK